jgi:hypothetical protein
MQFNMKKLDYSNTALMDFPYRPTELSPIKKHITLQPIPKIDITNCITKCRELEATLRMAIVEVECPVCYEVLGDKGYVIPTCGHKTCVGCFVNNITHNKHTGDCCVLCRKKYA